MNRGTYFARFLELYALAAEGAPSPTGPVARIRLALDAAKVWLDELMELQRSHGIEVILGIGALIAGAVLLNPEWDTFGTSRAGAYQLVGQILPERAWACVMIAHGAHWIFSVVAARQRKRWAVPQCFLACNIALGLWGLFAFDFWLNGLPSMGGAILLIPWSISLLVHNRLQIVLRYEQRYRRADQGG